MRSTNLSAHRLRELLDYDSNTGIFRWKKTRQIRFIGKIAGSTRPDGYRIIEIDGLEYREHRLAWLYIYGKWPSSDIDHINRVRYDNKISNLREATRSENKQNSCLQKNNKSGVRGVSWKTREKKWVAQIGIFGKKHFLGYFNSKEDAYAAYCKAAEIHHTHNELAIKEKP